MKFNEIIQVYILAISLLHHVSAGVLYGTSYTGYDQLQTNKMCGDMSRLSECRRLSCGKVCYSDDCFVGCKSWQSYATDDTSGEPSYKYQITNLDSSRLMRYGTRLYYFTKDDKCQWGYKYGTIISHWSGLKGYDIIGCFTRNIIDPNGDLPDDVIKKLLSVAFADCLRSVGVLIGLLIAFIFAS